MCVFNVAPQRNFEIAFKMFDLNGDGEVDMEEFEQASWTMGWLLNGILVLNAAFLSSGIVIHVCG